ncbi:MAG: hypothetical protein DME83_03800 [Verrucomicrobia bacterium]|nr:MAG: hypothetical protein DME83_03800 [Verrucomicrobiota bacterium]
MVPYRFAIFPDLAVRTFSNPAIQLELASRIDSGSNKKSASRKLGSSFQKAQPTSAKSFRRRISAACVSVGGLESEFTVEPCPTIKSALLDLEVIFASNVGRQTPNV